MACYLVNGVNGRDPIHVFNELEPVFAGYQVNKLVNTKGHDDHIGNNAWYQEHKTLGPAYAHE